MSLLFFHGSICAVEESFYLHFLSSQLRKDKSWKTIGCMRQSIQEKTKQNLWRTAFKKFEGVWSASPFTFFEGFLPQILLGSFLNTLSHISQKILKLEQKNDRLHLVPFRLKREGRWNDEG